MWFLFCGLISVAPLTANVLKPQVSQQKIYSHTRKSFLVACMLFLSNSPKKELHLRLYCCKLYACDNNTFHHTSGFYCLANMSFDSILSMAVHTNLKFCIQNKKIYFASAVFLTAKNGTLIKWLNHVHSLWIFGFEIKHIARSLPRFCSVALCPFVQSDYLTWCFLRILF